MNLSSTAAVKLKMSYLQLICNDMPQATFLMPLNAIPKIHMVTLITSNHYCECFFHIHEYNRRMVDSLRTGCYILLYSVLYCYLPISYYHAH